MTMLVEWRNGHHELAPGSTLLVAFPGVGNIGKVALESIRCESSTVEVARLHPVGLPPLAELDEDGLLAPPHLSLCRTITRPGCSVLTLRGTAQPNEPSTQSSMARELMAFFEQQSIEQLLVLTGMVDQPDRKALFAVTSSASHRIELEARGVDVRRDEPRSGAIGVAALLASMGPLYGIHSACIIASSVGSSGDVLASQRMLEHLNRWFDFGFDLPSDGSFWLKERLEAMAPAHREDLVKEMTASHDAFYM